MSQFIKRCRGIIENRGLIGFFLFVFSRTFRQTRDVVFEKDPRDSNRESEHLLASDLTVHLIDKRNVADPELSWLLSQSLSGENAIYADGLKKDGCSIVVTKGKIVVHVSFVQFDTSYKKILNEPYSVPLIGNCWTSPSCRGQGIYPRIIAECCKVMASRGFERILISCAPDNIASIAGIKKANFRRVRIVHSYIALTKILFQKVESEAETRYRVARL